MKKIKFLAVAVAMFALSVSAFAQNESFGNLKLTYSPVTFKGDVIGSTLSDEKMTGFGLTFTESSPLAHSFPLYIDYGVGARYSFAKEKEFVGGTATTHFLSFNIPVSLMINVPVGDFVSIAPLAGVDANIYAMGFTKAGSSKSTDFFSEKSNPQLNRFVVNWHAGARLYLGPIFLGFSYEAPITKLYSLKANDTNIASITSSQMNISLGFKF